METRYCRRRRLSPAPDHVQEVDKVAVRWHGDIRSDAAGAILAVMKLGLRRRARGVFCLAQSPGRSPARKRETEGR